MTSAALRHPLRVGFTVAITVGLFYTACTGLWVVFHEQALDFLNALFHGLDFRRIEVPAWEFRVGTFFYPFFVLVVWGFLMGTFFSWLYECLGADGSVRRPKDAK